MENENRKKSEEQKFIAEMRDEIRREAKRCLPKTGGKKQKNRFPKQR